MTEREEGEITDDNVSPLFSGVIKDESEQSNEAEAVPIPQREEETPQPVHATVSRRRLAFRPATTSFAQHDNPLNTLAAAAEAVSMANNDNEASTSQQNRHRQMSFWSSEEIGVFYEALKVYGRDWDACFRALKKKKISKGKEQMKNFFFNVIRMMRQITNFDSEEQFRLIPKDSRELFMMVNALEWKRRTGNIKYIPENMRQLLLEGSTCVRLKKKKQPLLVLKTPACPALMRLFLLDKRVDKFPAEMTIQLEPLRYSDAAFLVNAQRNPYLKVRMNSNERITRLFQLLKVKWGDNMKHLGEGGSSVNFRIRPHRDTPVGKVFFTEQHPVTAPSLRKLLRDCEEAERLASMKRESPSAIESYTVSVSQLNTALTINSELLYTGMTLENVRDASVAELYCVCGLTTTVRLVYEVCDVVRLPSPWSVLTDLMKRDYSDSIANRRESQDDDSVSGSARKRDRDLERDDVEPAVKLPRIDVAPARSTIQAVPQPAVESEVVTAENAAFMQQMHALRSTSTRSSIQKASQRGRGPIRGGKAAFVTLPPPRPAVPVSSTLLHETPGHTDFSFLDENSSSTCSWLASLRTPEKRREARSAAPGVEGGRSAAQQQQPTSPTNFAELHHDDTARDAHHDNRAVALEIQCFGGPLDLSPMKSTSSFNMPDDLQAFKDSERMCDQVLNQNSVDFCSNFQQLVDHMDGTPQKSRHGK